VFYSGEGTPQFEKYRKLGLLLTNSQGLYELKLGFGDKSYLYMETVKWQDPSSSHDRWPQRFENNMLYCYLQYIASACLCDNSTLEIKIKTLLQKTCDTVKFKKNRSIMLDMTPFLSSEILRIPTFHRHLAKYLCDSRCFLFWHLSLEERRGCWKTNKHFSSSFPYATPNYHICLILTWDSFKCLLCLDLR